VRGRHLTTAVTLLVLVGILVLGVALGAKSFFAPIPGDDEPTATPACATQKVGKGEKVSATQVQVSVYNAGSRAGLADKTMARLTGRGFKKGDVGNAPSETKVKVAQVWTTERNDAAARLVARQFGRATKVRFVDTDLGPGVDVVVGDEFRALAKAQRSIVVKRASSACLTQGASPDAG
jgi:hypothetical protein